MPTISRFYGIWSRCILATMLRLIFTRFMLSSKN